MKAISDLLGRSLLAKMLAGGLGCVLLVGAAWYGVGRALDAHKDDLFQLATVALKTEVDMLGVRRHEKDVIIRDLRSTSFHTTGESKNMRKHKDALERLHADIASLSKWKEELGDMPGKLDKAVSDYEASFAALIAAYRDLGEGTTGQLGRLRTSQRTLGDLIAAGDDVPMQRAVIEMEHLAADYVLRGDEASGRKLRKFVDSMLVQARALETDRDAVVGKVLDYASAVDACMALRERIGLTEDKGLRGSMRSAIHKLAPLTDQARATADGLVEDARDTQQLASLLLLLGGLLIAGIVFVLYSRSLTRPLAKLREATRRYTAGEKDVRVETQAQDEIGTLSRSIQRMMESLRTADREREEVFEGITETTSRLSAASSEILAATTQQSTGAEEQAAAVSQTVATIDEVLHAAEEGASRAEEVTEASRQSVESSRDGTQSVEATLERMREVKASCEELSAGILELDGRAESIGAIIATVGDIAEQTNLLALNAAIEASRAGEHGRGFAVVASEVRALADECKKATAQVRDLLGEVQRSTRVAVTRTRDSVEGVNNAVSMAERAGEAIRTLERALSSQSQVAVQIDASARQQAIGIKQINEAVRSIDQVTRQNVDSNRQTQRAMEDLSAMGDQLRSLVGLNGQEG
ncbi:MAG: methyl-accepting chemotaxis protein [Planctomycetota bacterium]|nr:methyl-accepting chemotaxis protein [Planctomycetota bacterium]